MILHLKSCPKCNGDVELQQDSSGKYLTCLQCGWLEDLPAEKRSRPVAVFAQVRAVGACGRG